jgi:hypothetical protein
MSKPHDQQVGGADISRDAAPYIDRVLDMHHFLSNESDLSPRNPQLNAVLFDFVHETMRPRHGDEVATILDDPRIRAVAPSLRRLLGQAEYEMERYSAAAMTGAIDKSEANRRYASYAEFIYRGHYEALVDNELQSMRWQANAPSLDSSSESVAFAGAGPLPISAIMLHKRTGWPVTCIDRDAEACRLGRQVIRHLTAHEPGYESLDSNVRYVHAAGADHDYSTHPVVFVASLIEKKDSVVSRILQTSQTAVITIIRSAEGLGSLIYQPEDGVATRAEYNLHLTGKSAASPRTINTSLIYRFPAGKRDARIVS